MSEKKGKDSKKKEDKVPIIIKNATDLQRLKLEKLMKNPEKPVVLPDAPRARSLAAPPDFVRNVMGSSAGAGSGEFHVYRHLRRKEYARQKFIQEKSEKEKLDDEYHQKIEDNVKVAEEKTAKKRAKRLKKKKMAKLKAKKPKTEQNSQKQSKSDDSSDDDDDDAKSKASDKSGSDSNRNTTETKSEDHEPDNSIIRDENPEKNNVGIQ